MNVNDMIGHNHQANRSNGASPQEIIQNNLGSVRGANVPDDMTILDMNASQGNNNMFNLESSCQMPLTDPASTSNDMYLTTDLFSDTITNNPDFDHPSLLVPGPMNTDINTLVHPSSEIYGTQIYPSDRQDFLSSFSDRTVLPHCSEQSIENSISQNAFESASGNFERLNSMFRLPSVQDRKCNREQKAVEIDPAVQLEKWVKKNGSRFCCVGCDRSFISKENCLTHIRLVHDKHILENRNVKLTSAESTSSSRDTDSTQESTIKKDNLQDRTDPAPAIQIQSPQLPTQVGSSDQPIDVEASVRKCGRDHQCLICGKKFALRNNCTRHIRIVHLQIKEFECKVCHKRFSTKCNLDQHSRTHRNRARY